MGKDKMEEMRRGSKRGLRKSQGAEADWTQVDAESMRSAVAAAARTGGAIRFGYTSDGGAFAIGIYGDGDRPYTEYVRPGESVEIILEEVIALFEDIWAEQLAKMAQKATKKA